jgi:hypothetical protein
MTLPQSARFEYLSGFGRLPEYATAAERIQMLYLTVNAFLLAAPDLIKISTICRNAE